MMEIQKTNNKPLLTVTEAANYIGYHRDTVQRLVRSGRIRALKPNGGRYLIRQVDLIAFLEGGKDTPKITK